MRLRGGDPERSWKWVKLHAVTAQHGTLPLATYLEGRWLLVIAHTPTCAETLNDLHRSFEGMCEELYPQSRRSILQPLAAPTLYSPFALSIERFKHRQHCLLAESLITPCLHGL